MAHQCPSCLGCVFVLRGVASTCVVAASACRRRFRRRARRARRGSPLRYSTGPQGARSPVLAALLYMIICCAAGFPVAARSR
eukprot:390013-Pleurochrysis_carterae.AAC.3